MKVAATFLGAVIAGLLVIAMLFTAGWVRPPILGTQVGFRGLAMDQLITPVAKQKLEAANALPEALPKSKPEGPKASEAYKNVQVLKDLTVVEFNTAMAAITNWVAPQQGCAYCHNTDNLAEDTNAKKVSRRMIEMTRHINKDWKAHVVNTGVVCWTCHRGNPIPSYVWTLDQGYPQARGGFAASNYGLGHPNWTNGSTAMQQDPYKPLVDKADVIRVQATKALPALGTVGAPILTTEQTYSLMIAVSQSLGVNCVFCHNSRSFVTWPDATPQRATAWHGIQMTRDLNTAYLDPLKDLVPASRLGPAGDAPKANCMTCHQGANKPLLGVSMAKDWPEFGGTPAK